MDPDAALQRLRELLDPAKVDAALAETTNPGDAATDILNEVCDVFAGLDSWMSKGGFAPDNWKR